MAGVLLAAFVSAPFGLALAISAWLPSALFAVVAIILALND